MNNVGRKHFSSTQVQYWRPSNLIETDRLTGLKGGNKVYSYGYGTEKQIKMKAYILYLIGEGGAEKASMERTNEALRE